MANLMDYLDWRGDLTLAQSPFNEVDNLILAELSFVILAVRVDASKGENRRVLVPGSKAIDRHKL